MNADFKNSLVKKYRNKYLELSESLDSNTHSDSTPDIDKAFSLLIRKRNNEKTIFEKDLVSSIINSAIIAVREIGLGRTSVIGLFLHHAFLNNEIDKTAIREEYGESAALITEGLAKVSEIDEKTSSSQAENFRKLLLNLAKDVRVILIKLAEQTELMREMKQMKNEDQYRIASEASFLYAPLAHRLGLYLIKSEMEDLSLKYTNRSTYDMIAKKLAATMRARKKFIDEFIQPISNELSLQNFQFEIKGRPKSIHSIWSKMKKKDVEFDDIYDLFAIRIILKSDIQNEKADCWQVYSVVTDKFQPNPLRMRDWISVPKTNGYESLHTTVIGPGGKWVEVQIRTERMNEVAEKGVAAHWKYKGAHGEQGLDEWLTRIREILDTPETDAGNFIDDFKLSLYSKEIFVFTPKGELRKFPAGASVLDFAYEIHTDVGASCIGAKVNGKSVPIRHEMHNGDKIEILTSKNQIPKLDWLHFAVTSKAQKKIRQKLNEDKVKDAEAGKEIIQRRFRNWKVEYNDESVRKLLNHYKFSIAQDFYCMIANGKIDLSEVKEVMSSRQERTEPEASTIEDLENAAKTPVSDRPGEDYILIDENVDSVDFKLAKCCSPVMGDPVFGFVTIHEGIKIHRTNCPNAVQLVAKYGYRIVNAKWNKRSPDSIFPVNIAVTGENEGRILKSISDVMAKDMKVSVRAISMDRSGGVITGRISLLVRNIDQLDLLIQRLVVLKGIYSVSRLDSK